MEENYSWIYLLIFLIIPLARILPRVLKRAGLKQNTSTRPESPRGNFFQESSPDNFQESSPDNFQESSPDNFRESPRKEEFSTKNWSKEKEMIADAFKIIEEFPFVVTYNGDEFDLPYLYNRAERLGIANENNPLYMMRDSATLKHGVHIDLYRTLSNRSFQIYAFSQSYTDFSLNSVSKALLGKEKIDYGLDFDKLSL